MDVSAYIVEPTVAQHSFNFEAAQLPTKSVVVYADKAEVKRQVNAKLAKGTNEIIIQNVSAVIERQSVRVDGSEVLIQEVQYQEMPIDTIHETEKVRNLEDQKFDLEWYRTRLEDDITSLRKRIEVLDGVVAQISASSNGGVLQDSSPEISSILRDSSGESGGGSLLRASSIGFLMDEEYLSNLAKFLSYYGETVSQLKSDMRKKQRDAERIHKDVEKLERRIDQLRCGYEYDSIKRNISIIVEVDAEKEVELFVSYQVYCAGWKPTYDIRASTTSESGEVCTVKLCYYGLVEQNTGDMWRDADLVLSSSTPSVGGCAPPLATLAASIQKQNKNGRQRHVSSRRKPLTAPSEEDMGFGSFDELHDAAALQRLTLNHISSDSNSSSSLSIDNFASASFSISRAVTIPSNGVEHKVLIAQIDLQCAFLHDAVPCKSANAFLSAVITNTSCHPLLPGSASVYLNNGFVSKTYLPAVAPGEEFRTSLGMDPSVKIEYKTPQRTIEQIGFMSKSSLITHDQIVSLRNAKVSQSVQITVKDQIPKASDEKIKVCIMHPEIRGRQAGEARLNKEHNLEWTVILAPGQQRDLHIKYTIEHPANENLAYKSLYVHANNM